MYTIQEIPVEIQTSHCNLISRSVSASPNVIAQQYSSVTFVSLCFQSHEEKFGARFTKFKYICIAV
jgi:hypothetical protein